MTALTAASYKKIFVKRIKDLVAKAKESAHKREQAMTLFSAILLSKSFRAWDKKVKAETPENASGKRKTRLQRKKGLKTHAFTVWKSKAQKPMQRAKAALTLSKGLQKIMTQIAWNKYRSEVGFFKEIEARVALGRELFKKQVTHLISTDP